ncbi:MAG TPA: site-2 protease family protein [Blastocatellia bacterium]|nr:site-2 protease family protein [Blastocatellia bacterium]
MRLRPFHLATVSGIPLMVDYLWLPVAVLHFGIVSIFYLPDRVGNIGVVTAYILGAVLTVLMFGSIVAHELAHALVAKIEHIRTREIRLHVFGGYARLESEPKTAMAELRIAIAGPVASFLLGAIFMLCLLLAQLVIFGPLRFPLQEMFLYLFTGNVALAMFNLIPGLPLDGGRVLRAYLWHRNKDILTATLTAKRLGVALAYMLASYGIYRAVWWRDPFTAVWLIVLAFFLKRAAEEDYRYRKLQSEYTKQTGIDLTQMAGTVATIMKQPPIAVAPSMRVSEFLDEVLAKHRVTSFPVALDGRLHGLLLLEKLRALPEAEWDKTIVRDVMQPVDETLFVSMKASIEHATKKLHASPQRYLAVLDGDGFLVGSLSTADLEQAR